MRLLYQIFIIIFVLTSLFIVKDDLISLYNRSVGYLNTFNKVNTLTSSTSQISNEVAPLSQTINTSGPLRVLNNLFNGSTSKTVLSQKKVIDLTNKARLENGNLSPLKENSKLDFSAEKKLQDMFMKQYFEHISPSGVGVGDLANEISYQYIIIGENLALGNFKDDQALVDAWMASAGHRANILNVHYTEIGVAVGKGKFEGKDVWIAVTHFGLPKSACPSIDEVLHGIITLNQKQIKTMEADLTLRHSKIDSGAVYNGLTTNEQINEYNGLVITYNNLVSDIKQKISEYNNGVKVFNACISTNTK